MFFYNIIRLILVMLNHHLKNILRSVFPFFYILILLFSCSKKNFSYLPEYHFKSLNSKPDYANLNYWAAHPYKNDPGDSVPAPLRSTYIKDSLADVFFIHPTTLTAKNDPRWNAPIDDAALNEKTDYTTILYQASAFNEKCRVFAPRYRQAHYRSFFVDTAVSGKYLDLAYEDIRNAFLYYLQYENKGRPIIIASHSQGTVHAARLLKEFFENKPLQKQLVCAYIIGMPVPSTYFQELKPCTGPASTGCYMSWRSYHTGYTEPLFVANEKYSCVVTNPLSWRTDTVFVAAKYNLGAVLFSFNKIIKRVVSARVHHNILWCSKPNVFGKIFIKKQNYHAGDINLFYMNIRENVVVRIAAFGKAGL